MDNVQEFMCSALSALSIECPEDVSDSSLLFDDLGLDSLQVYELSIVTEELAGRRLEHGAIPTCRTAGELYRFFVACRDGAAGEAPAPRLEQSMENVNVRIGMKDR